MNADELARLSEDDAFFALVQVLWALPAVDRRSLCGMPRAFWLDFSRELTGAAMFGDPGRIKVDVHHRNNGIVEQATFTPERDRKYRIAKR